MNIQLNARTVVCVLVATVSLVGCGQAMQSSGVSGSSGALEINDPIDGQNSMAKINSAADSAEAALVDAQAALDSIIQNGKLNLDSSSPSTPGDIHQQSLTGISEKLKAILDQVLSKISLPVQKAKDMINQARSQIAGAMAALDPVRDASAIAKLNQMMARLDVVEARLGQVYKLLADKVDVLVGTVDKLIAKLSASGNPLMLIVVYEFSEVRTVLADFSSQLASL